MFVSDALSRLHIGAQEDINDVIPLNFFTESQYRAYSSQL